MTEKKTPITNTKHQLTPEERRKNIQKATAALLKNSTGVIIPLSDSTDFPTEFIPTPILDLNLILGGNIKKKQFGIPVGRATEIYGPYSSGKSTLAIAIAAMYQQMHPDEEIIFIETEGRTFGEQWYRTLGLDLNRCRYVRLPNAEESLNALAMYTAAGAGLILMDSVAGLTTEKEIEADVGDSGGMCGIAKLMAQTFRKASTVMMETGSTVIFTNQIRDKIGKYGGGVVTPGGHALEHWVTTKISCYPSKIKSGAFLGQGFIQKYCTVKNQLKNPYQKAQGILVSDVGYDTFGNLMTTGKRLGIVKQVQSYYNLTEGDLKWQRSDFMESSEIAAEITDLITEKAYEIISDPMTAGIDLDVEAEEPTGEYDIEDTLGIEEEVE